MTAPWLSSQEIASAPALPEKAYAVPWILKEEEDIVATLPFSENLGWLMFPFRELISYETREAFLHSGF